MPKMNIEELNSLYREADEADKELFAEQRSNVLLVAGEHYAKKGSKFWNRIRTSSDLDRDQKLRLTKNHIQKITKIYKNNLVSYCPDVSCQPKNEQELQDQKAAELHNSVLQDIKDTHRLQQKVEEYASDFIEIGEVAVKLFWDMSAGKFKGYEQKVDDNGAPIFDEMGQPAAGEKGVFSGDLVFEKLYGFNLLRHPDAKSMPESPCQIIRKMSRIKEIEMRLEASYEGRELADKKKMLEPSKDETYTIFEGEQYKDVKDQVMLREYYYRPCIDYPMGYYYITVEGGILWEGDLPLGIYPIFYAGFDQIQTSPRCRSIIKQLRPYQAEINRAASKIAEHQITLGDDKLIMANGAKMSNGGQQPGVRGLTINGPPPQIMPGRSGEQYLPYMNSQIEEMYSVAMINEDMMEKDGQFDPYAMLFKSMDQKKKFTIYSSKFSRFLIDLLGTALELKREYASESDIIPVIGRNEMVNISEFKNQDDLHYQIKIIEQTNDVETKFGKQLMLNHILQYAGTQLKPDDVGRIIKQMPYANEKEIFSDLTLDYDTATNIILALDRGEEPMTNPMDNHPYIIKRLAARMRQADFRFLPGEIQQMYQMQLQLHEQHQVRVLQQEQAMQAQLIPTGGYLVTCDFYVNDPQKPGVARRARLPYESLVWLIKRIEAQGMSLEALMSMDDAVRADIYSQALNQVSNPGMEPSYASAQPSQGAASAQQLNGQANPGGIL